MFMLVNGSEADGRPSCSSLRPQSASVPCNVTASLSTELAYNRTAVFGIGCGQLGAGGGGCYYWDERHTNGNFI